MGRVLHGSATTTEAVRRAIHQSQASLRDLASRYGVNPKTIAKWRKRTSVADLPGAAEPGTRRSQCASTEFFSALFLRASASGLSTLPLR
jgi:transposase-like protein